MTKKATKTSALGAAFLAKCIFLIRFTSYYNSQERGCQTLTHPPGFAIIRPVGSGRAVWGAAPKKQGKLPGMRREFIIRNRVRKAFFCEGIRGEMLFYTRMIGMWSLSVLHAELTISLSESKCSLLRRAYPNGGNVGPGNSAREAANEFARRHMLAQVVRAAA